jgi:hypothetical protein
VTVMMGTVVSETIVLKLSLEGFVLVLLGQIFRQNRTLEAVEIMDLEGLARWRPRDNAGFSYILGDFFEDVMQTERKSSVDHDSFFGCIFKIKVDNNV